MDVYKALQAIISESEESLRLHELKVSTTLCEAYSVTLASNLAVLLGCYRTNLYKHQQKESYLP